jgi:serine kinase of HPr protein (carbohydrate metabolism regulator)
MATLTHGTVILVGATGLLLVGASGAGKSMLALRLLEAARLRGHFAALIADDQVWLEDRSGQIIAACPDTIRGKIEMRGSGIGAYASADAAVVDLVIEPVAVTADNRIPDEDRRWTAPGGVLIPLIAIDRAAADPFAILAALLTGFPNGQPY